VKPAIIVCLLALLTAAAGGRVQATDVDRFLTEVAGFPASDLTELASGRVIARTTTNGDTGEIAVVAAVVIHSDRERVASYFRRFVTYEDGEVTLQVGEFHRPPQASDVARLTLPDGDIQALRACQPGECEVKIGGAGLLDLQAAVNWDAPDAADQANAFARRRLLAYVSDYLARGNAALVTYNDQSAPVSVADEWRGILQRSPNLFTYSAALATYLDRFPQASLAGGTDLLYWAKENYGGATIVHADHMVTWPDPAHPDRLTIAQKQIYASHYYNGSLAITTVVDRQDARPASTLIYCNRSRGDLLKGGLGGLKRRLAERQARSAAEATLGAIKTALESAGGPPAPTTGSR
jgi:hypothetical protein